jgi:hypothetical protein
MSGKRKNIKKKATPKIGAIISDRIGNHENHPFFVKKAERAKAFIEKNGLPKELTRKHS